jgi:hypothetical protein
MERESFASVLVMPPRKSAFEVIPKLGQILMEEWRKNKDTKKIEIAGEESSDKVMSYNEYLKIYDFNID